MGKFVCPQCHADVTKEPGDGLGCPCCGYACEGVTPYTPWPWLPYTSGPWKPDEDYTGPIITWDNTSGTYADKAGTYGYA